MSMWHSSKSRISLLLGVLALALGAGVVVGCGDDGETTSNGGSTAAVSTETGATATSVATGQTGESGATDTAEATTETDDGGVGVDDDGGAGDEEEARTPVSIAVVGNGFSAATARKVHVPSFISIELDVTVKGRVAKTLLITRAGGAQKTHVFPGGERTTLRLEGLRPGRSLIVGLGGDRVTIVADAEPGP